MIYSFYLVTLHTISDSKNMPNIQLKTKYLEYVTLKLYSHRPRKFEFEPHIKKKIYQKIVATVSAETLRKNTNFIHLGKQLVFTISNKV